MKKINNTLNVLNEQDLENHIHSFLLEWKTEESRRDHKRGASLSHVLEHLRFRGWRGLSDTWRLEDVVTALGFRVVPAKLKSGKDHKFNRVITFKSEYRPCYRCGGEVTLADNYLGCETCGADQREVFKKRKKPDTTTFKIVHNKEWDEYQVQVFEFGELNEARTYHTDDPEDAKVTFKAMVEEERINKQNKEISEHNKRVKDPKRKIIPIVVATGLVCEICDKEGTLQAGSIHQQELYGEQTTLCTDCLHEVINEENDRS